MSVPAHEPDRTSAAPAVSVRGIVKRFGSLEALKGVDLDFCAGEIHGLLGENGAGKSTLMNILYGIHQPDAGSIEVAGAPVRLRTPHDAVAHGIGMVHQHFKLVPTLTVAENMLLARTRGPFLGRRLIAQTAARIRELSDEYGLEVDPRARVWQLSVGEQQRVEILRALYHEARVLILDEPTATLTPREADQLLSRLRSLADAGAAVVFITHHLDEVIAWTHRISVLRHGRHVTTLTPGETTTRELARLMVGRDVALQSLVVDAAGDEHRRHPRPAAPPERAGTALRVENLTARSDLGTVALDRVTFSVEAGEIVAVAGVEGNGQIELEESLIGLRPASDGKIQLRGTDLTRLSTRERLAAGMALVPSDRYRRGLIRELSVADNLVYDRVGAPPYGSALSIDRPSLLKRASELVDRYAIQTSSLRQPVGRLSGGNAQRVVLARTVNHDVRCLVAAQPTRGLDVGAMEFVWEMLEESRAAGVAVLLVSTDLDEVLALADRCCVLYRGGFVAELSGSSLSRERVGLAMGGAANVGDPERPAAVSVSMTSEAAGR